MPRPETGPLMKVCQLLSAVPISLPQAIHACYGDDPEWETHIRYRIEREVGQSVERWDQAHAAGEARALAEDLDI